MTVILRVLHFSNVHVDSSLTKVQRPDALYGFERRVSPMVTTMLIAAVGANWTLLQRLLGGLASTLACRREVFACFNVTNTAAATLPPDRRRGVECMAVCSTSFCLSQGLLFFDTNLPAKRCAKLYATDASPNGVGGCVAPPSHKRLALFDVARRGGRTRALGWLCSRRTTCFEDGLGCFVFVPFFKGQYINFLELESLIRLLTLVTREGVKPQAALRTCGFARGFGSRLKGRSSSRKVDLLRKLGFWCRASDMALELVWVPAWANLADAPSRNK